MLIDLFNSARIGDYYMFAIPIEQFWLAAVAYLSLLGSIPWLANLEQPRPNWS